MADTIDFRAIDRGLEALTGSLQSADVRTAVAVFRADFLAASQQVDVLSDYVDLHELLDDLEFRCYNPIASQVDRFPEDEQALETLADHALTFGQIVARLRDIAARPTASGELAWIDELVKADALLQQAIEARDAAALKRWRRLVKRELDRRPSLINARVNAAARSLRMDAIEQGMATILNVLRKNAQASVQLEAIEAGRASLTELNQRLPSLVRDLDRWQDVDVELRRVEAVLATDPDELELSWPGIKAQVLALLANEDETALSAESARLDDALAAKDTVKGQRYFIRFRRLAAQQFYRVVAELKDLCNRLRTLGAPLADVARLIVTSPPAAPSPTPPLIMPSPPVGSTRPELQLLITLAPEGKTLSYTLNSADGEYIYFSLDSVALQASPRELLQSTYDRLSTLAKLSAATRTPDQTQHAIRELADIGFSLYDQLFPDAFKEAYRTLRVKYSGCNLWLISNESWIPWEMVRPVAYDQGGVLLYDDPPLCEMFQLSRWIRGRAAPEALDVDNIALIAPADSLAATAPERDFFTDLRNKHPKLGLVGPMTTLAEVEAGFRSGDTRIFHFTCAGALDTDDPNESRLRLTDGILRPSRIAGGAMAGLRKAKPLVFLSSSHGGRVGAGLTGLAGWAWRFIEAGASAFIGALWEVNDSLAAMFAREFYIRLFGLSGHEPMALGQAFHEARMAIKAADPANPTWLSYVLYGNPNTRITLTDAETGGHSESLTFAHGYALLIGVTESQVASWTLPGVAKDIAALHAVLAHPKRCGYPAENIRVIIGPEATRQGILDGVAWLAARLQADTSGNTTAVIYYSGDSWCDRSRQPPAYYLVPYDVRESTLATRSLLAEDFAAAVRSLMPRRMLVVLDCTHAAGMGAVVGTIGNLASTAFPPALLMGDEKEDATNSKDLNRLARGAGWAVLSSSQGDQPSYFRRDGRMSIFTYHLIEALTGHAQSAESATEVLVSDLISYVWRRVPASARADWGADQQPDYQISGNFPVALLLGGQDINKDVTPPDPLELLPSENVDHPAAPRTDEMGAQPIGPLINRRSVIPEEFIGRATEFKRITSLLMQRQSVSLVGPLGSGKSSVLAYLQHTARKWFAGDPRRVVYLDCQRLTSPQDFYEELCHLLGKPGKTAREAQTLLQDVSAALLIDEFEALNGWPIAQAHELSGWLRSMLQQGPTTAVIATQRPLAEVSHQQNMPGSSLGNILSVVTLGPFSADEAHDLLTARLTGTQITISEAEITKLYQESQGLPRELMRLAAELYSQKIGAGQRPPESRPAVWLYMATGDDPAQLDLLARKDQVTWGANPNTRTGDIILMYRTAPSSDIAYLFRAKSEARPTERTGAWNWDFGVELEDKVTLHNPVSLKTMRSQPTLRSWNLLRANMQGAMRRREGIQEEGPWASLRGLLVAWNPDAAAPLTEWEKSSRDALLADVLEQIKQMPDGTQRAKLLSGLATHLSTPLLASALDIAQTTRVDDQRALALAALAPYLPEDERESALTEAIGSALKVKLPENRARVLSDLIAFIPRTQAGAAWQEILQAVAAIEDSKERAVTLAHLIPALPVEMKESAAKATLAAAEASGSVAQVAEAWADRDEFDLALSATERVSEPVNQARAYGRLSVALAGSGQKDRAREIWENARRIAQAIQDKATQKRALAALEKALATLMTTPEEPATPDFSAYIAQVTRDFTGRDWVFAEIDAWLAVPSAPAFFLITGAPGAGKTAILAKLTQTRDVSAAYFCMAGRPETLDPAVFTRSIASQLDRIKASTKAPFVEIQRRLVDALLRLPVTETYKSRSVLLQRLPAAPLLRSASIARLDLNNIVSGLSQLGRLNDERGTRPLIVLVDNALTYIPEGELENTLIQIRRELESWYGPETQPASSSSLPVQEVFRRDVLSPLMTLYSGGYDRPLVIAVDALDDAMDWQGDQTIADLLAGSLDLPPQVRFVLTSRPDARVLSRLEQIGAATLDLDSHPSQNTSDVRAYLEQAVQASGVKDVVAQASVQVSEVVERVTAASQGSFQVARQTLADVAAGKLSISELMGRTARPWSERLSPAAKAALAWAEAWSETTDADEVYTEYVLAGLYGQPDGPVRRLLTLFEEEATVRTALGSLANMMTRTSLRLDEVQVAPTQALAGFPLSRNLNLALDQAARIADQAGETEISPLRLLAGLQAATHSMAARWVAGRLRIDPEVLARLLAEAPGNELPVEAIRTASRRQKVSSRHEALTRIELLHTDLLALSVDAIVHATSPALDFSGAIGGKIAQKLGEGFLNRVQGMPKPELGGALITDADSLPAHHIIHTPIRQVNHPSTPETVAQGVVAALSAAASMEDIQTVAFSAMGATSGLNHAQVAPLVLEAAVGYLEQNARPTRVLFVLETSDTYDVYLAALEAMQPGEAPTVPITTWYLSGAGVSRLNAKVGQPLELAVQLTPQPRDQSIPFQIPITTRHVTFYVEAPGFHLDTEDRQTVSLVQDPPTERTLTVALRPLIDGDQKVTIAAYSGVRLEGLRPAELVIPISVARADVLPPIPELIEPRAIPEPQPDIVLYVALEGSPSKRHLQIYVTCLALGKERQRLDPLPLTGKNAEEVRLAAIRAAAGAGAASLPDATAALHAFGATLFDLLLPRGHVLRELYFKGLRRLLGASLLIVSDEDVVLPWEMVCAYYFEENRPGMQFDDFWGRQFVVTHWVGRKGRSLASEAPLGQIDLTHYQQYEEAIPRRWQAVMGGDQVVSLETGAGHLALMQPGSPYYGLHILQFTDQRGHSRITRARETEAAARQDGEARELLYGRRLDFTLRRPVVGLSFVHGNTPGAEASLGSRDTRLERGWMLPMMHAGATAIVGPRWSTSSEADQTFYGAFYAALRTGMTVGWATWIARLQTRLAFPSRPDWLAYTCFGHPNCAPYLVRPSEGFVSFEELDHAADTPLLAGRMYSFLASYRTEAPEWFGGRLWAPQELAQGEAVSAIVVPLTGQVSGPDLAKLLPLQQTMPGGDFERVFKLTMPNETTTEPVLIRFQRGGQELGTVILNLDIVKGA